MTVGDWSAPPSPDLRRALVAAFNAHPELLREIEARSPRESYRSYLLYAAERLAATRTRNLDLAYGGPAEFLADLRLVQSSLAEGGALRQANGELQHLIWQAETFGFHLAGLEVRQHSRVHARALAELRAGETASPDAPPVELSPMTAEVLETIRVVAWIQRRYGVEACRRYIVSFTTSADDIAAVYELARYALPEGASLDLDVVPLFESGDDLARAPQVLTGMLDIPAVRQRLEANGGHLEVMLGYSDSAKELGRPARRSACSRRRRRWRSGRLSTRCRSPCSTAGVVHSAGEAAPPAARCSPRRPARSMAGSRSPSRARSSSPGTAGQRSACATWSR